jgi:hypothetical protein
MEKLRIMLNFYTKQDFEKVRFYKLNSDQILQFLKAPNFVGPKAVSEPKKVIEAIKCIQKTRELKLFNRSEIVDALRHISQDHGTLSLMKPQSYVAAMIHATSKMKITDQVVWQSLAGYVAQRYQMFDTRSLSTIIYGLSSISQIKPIELNFDELFGKLELPLIMLLDQGDCDP